MNVVISVVSYNRKDLLEECLKGLTDQKYNNKVDIWVVDNASKDDSAALVEKKFPKVNLIRSSRNEGFAKAHNQVIKSTDADLVILLNPDTTVPQRAIDQIVDFIENNPNCGIASCRLIYPDGKLQSNGGDLPFGMALIAWLFNLESFGSFPNFHRLDKDYYQKPHEVGWVGGTFMAIKRDLINKIGGLDEKIFMYFEDTDYCYRARKAGFKTMLDPTITIEHISGASSDNPQLRQWTGEYQGLVYFYKKHFGLFAGFLIRLLSLISIFLRIVAFIVLGKWRIAETYFKVGGSLI